MSPIGPWSTCCRNCYYQGRDPIATEVHEYPHMFVGTTVICNFQILDYEVQVHTFQEHPHKTRQEEVMEHSSDN